MTCIGRKAVIALCILTSCLLSNSFAVSLQEANQLLHEGNYEELAVKLTESRASATSEEAFRIDKMLAALARFRTEGKAGPQGRSAIPRGGGIPPDPTTPAPTEGQRRIVTIGGHSGGWHAAVSLTSPYGPQEWTISPQFPHEWVKERWNQGFFITGVAGGENKWFVVMSKFKANPPGQQQYIGPGPIGESTRPRYNELKQNGYRVTSVGGFNQHWVMVLNTDTGWDEQRVTVPGPMDEKWVAQRIAEGYHITAGSGDIIIEENGSQTESFLVVATRGTGYGESSCRLRDQ